MYLPLPGSGWLFSLRNRMLLVLLLISLVISGAGATYVYQLKATAVRAGIDGRMQAAAAAAERLLPASLISHDALFVDDAPRDPAQARLAMARYCRLAGIDGLGFYAFEGDAPRWIAGATVNALAQGRIPVELYAPVQAGDTSQAVETRFQGRSARVLFVPGPPNSANRYLIAVMTAGEGLDRDLQQARIESAGVGVLMVLTGLLLSWLLAYWLAAPVTQLLAAVRRMRGGDYSTRLRLKGRGELQELASNFNAMSEAVAERQRLILRQAFEDGLTGLPNRSHMLELMQAHIVTDGTPFVVLLIDINQFKYVNDYLGYQTGDAMLVALAKRLASLMHLHGELCARLPGDEFALLFPNARIDGLPRLLARLESALVDPVIVSGQRLDLSVGIGVAAYPEHGESAELLLRHAEVAMYLAKRDHAAYAVYCTETEAHRRNRTALLADLREAIEGGQLRVHYQPKALLRDGSVTKAEALVRWAHPERGWIGPDEFIPFAEQTGRLRAITHWVVDTVTCQLAYWREEGLTLCVSVNVGMSDVEDDTFVAFVDRALRRHGINPSQLCLEITETGMMHRPKQLLVNLDRLRQLGVQLSIDDFGNGYSSFGYLAQMPVHELKIDRTFIERLEHNFENVSIVRSIIELGHILGLDVVAEGVETPAIWQALVVMGCDEAQGYLIARPMPADELTRWLEKGFDVPPPVTNMAPVLSA
ncbi:putative bifunctional diguanylate cyclase/phosphodiesterase [Jeongeupia naejangsanensis]|uniref:GGDEF domain-containing protein n=1 Tax=Jeongeupia naejangsanensis TaxID=613195 RepID=A0ABS2BK78_9NEIS|nr:GGDEF domain-containing protein [Jeongeupia naejangsanensis]MBM3115401.1 GGDEF domain-containing protein [Jeongeupia naejangsanensis]